MFWEKEVPTMSKNIERIQIWVKSFEILKGVAFGEVAGPQLQVFFNWIAYLLRTTVYQRNLQKKEWEFWNPLNIMLL